MSVTKRLLIHARLFEDDEDDSIEHSVVSCIDLLADDYLPGLIVVKGEVARNSYLIDRKRIRFDGGECKSGGLFRSLDRGGELRRGLVRRLQRLGARPERFDRCLRTGDRHSAQAATMALLRHSQLFQFSSYFVARTQRMAISKSLAHGPLPEQGRRV